MECCGHAALFTHSNGYREESKERKDKRITMPQSSEQQFRKRDVITFAVLNFWSPTPTQPGLT